MIVHGTTTGAAATGLPRMVLLVGAVGLLWLPTSAQGDPPQVQRAAAPKAERLPAPVQATPPVGGVPVPAADKPVADKPPAADVFAAMGTVQLVRSVALSPAVAGRVANIRVEAGATVKKGDLLVELDGERAKLEMLRAEAKLKSAEELHRIRIKMRESGQSGTVELKTSEMDVRVAQADLQLTQLALEGTRIVAPMDGTVLRWHAQVGQHIGVGQALGELADLRRVMAIVDLPPREVNRLAVGRRCRIQVPELDDTYHGAVGRIDPVVNQTAGTIRVYVTIDPPEKGDPPRPGSFVRVSLRRKSDDGA